MIYVTLELRGDEIRAGLGEAPKKRSMPEWTPALIEVADRAALRLLEAPQVLKVGRRRVYVANTALAQRQGWACVRTDEDEGGEGG